MATVHYVTTGLKERMASSISEHPDSSEECDSAQFCANPSCLGLVWHEWLSSNKNCAGCFGEENCQELLQPRQLLWQPFSSDLQLWRAIRTATTATSARAITTSNISAATTVVQFKCCMMHGFLSASST